MGSKMSYYNPENVGYDSDHEVLYTFMWEDRVAKVVTSMGGNVRGGGVMDVDLDTGMTVPVDHELTKKHVEFYSDEDKDYPYREVGYLKFINDEEELLVDIDECSRYLIAVEIVGFDE